MTGNVSRKCVHGPAHEYQNPPDVHSLFVVPQLPSEPGHSRHRDEVPISRPTGGLCLTSVFSRAVEQLLCPVGIAAVVAAVVKGVQHVQYGISLILLGHWTFEGSQKIGGTSHLQPRAHSWAPEDAGERRIPVPLPSMLVCDRRSIARATARRSGSPDLIASTAWRRSSVVSSP